MRGQRIVQPKSLLLLLVGAFVLVGCATGGDASSSLGEISPSNSVVVMEGVVTDTGRLITVVPSEIIFHLPERWTPGTGQVEAYPVPEIGEELVARTMDELKIPIGTPLIMFFAYLPRSPLDWSWQLKLALYPENQRPVEGLNDYALGQLDRLLYDGEDPTKDTIAAVIDLIEEGAAASELLGSGESDPELGQRTRNFFGVDEGPTAAEVAAATLSTFLDTAPDERQLSDMLGDIPPGADKALNVEWAWREVAVAYDIDRIDFTMIGLRVPGVGTLGPILLTDDPVIPLDGVLVQGRGFEVIAWSEDPASVRSSASAVVLGTVDNIDLIAALDSTDGLAVFIDLRSGFEATLMSGADLSKLVGGILFTEFGEPVPRSELDEGP